MKKVMIYILGIAGILFLGITGFLMYHKISPIGFGVHTPVYQTKGTALDGYDVTTYFTGDLKKGSEQHLVSWKGANWYFLSDENKQLFQTNPEAYTPQYGGYCMKAVETGNKVQI